MDDTCHPYFLRTFASGEIALYGMNEENTMYIKLRTFKDPIAARLVLSSYNRALRAAENNA